MQPTSNARPPGPDTPLGAGYDARSRSMMSRRMRRSAAARRIASGCSQISMARSLFVAGSTSTRNATPHIATANDRAGLTGDVTFIPDNYVTDGLVDLLARNGFDFNQPT
jgi:hypothetical protein